MFSRRTRLAALAGAAALAAAIALPASPAEAQSNCSFGAGYVDCYLQNQAGYFAAGDTHNKSVDTDTDASTATRYYFSPFETSGGETYGFISNTSIPPTLCWNFNTSLNQIGMDHCYFNGSDGNELFAMVPCHNGSWCINSYDWGGNYKLGGYPNDTPLYFENIGLGLPAYWDALTSP
jgi:hypothetical protein